MTSGCYVCLGKPMAGYEEVNVKSEEKRGRSKLQIASTQFAITQIPTPSQIWGDLISTLLFPVRFLMLSQQKLSLKIELRWSTGASNCNCTSCERQLEIVPLVLFQCSIIVFWCRCTQIVVESACKGITRDCLVHNSKVVLAYLPVDFLSSDDFQPNYSGGLCWESVCCFHVKFCLRQLNFKPRCNSES